ncbi:dihydroorotase [Microbulbifer hydrolyticus]|uniref:Dihydroorotase n=1 Tax=Microbulbifer hydrolyticus TaxID=48074 RepID=A0A6P1TA64_9GAMM|nr:dihydroorotase [Microbulbifer hydrolyticus]MBB5213285.1 dihydroorotase [Microbulbifer hydrolyticus]QHQ38553.1 dihydroorotase [Microbulbifer hydrolyticus]
MDSKQQITLRAPDDWHIHLRDGAALARTVGDAARQFRRAIIMPNLVPPVVNAEAALAYKARIEAEVPENGDFTPLMVIYLTDNTTPEVVQQAHAAGVVAAKLYPAGATTNSDSGVTDITNIYPALEAMQSCGMKLLLHGEVTTSDIDIFDRERVFIENILGPVVGDFPSLKIVLEHITTAHAAEFVANARDGVAATITAHHLLYNRNHMLVGGIRPHFYCLPILKRGYHQSALIEAATSGSPKFFLGTDSAPHTQGKKETACGCAGCYTAFSAIELYAEAFEQAGKLERLEGFASEFGPDFYGLPRNTGTITLVREPWTLPSGLQMGPDSLIPLAAGETLNWRLA